MKPRLEDEVVGVQSMIGEHADQMSYDERHGILAKHYLTMIRSEETQWIVDRLGDRLRGRTLVEIGAGVGIFATAAASVAKHVYAIESDPAWSWVFVRHLYQSKPTNLTWILDRAENLVDVIRGDLAVVITGSDAERLRVLAGKFASDVCLPWQDWNGGKAVVNWGHWLGGQREENGR